MPRAVLSLIAAACVALAFAAAAAAAPQRPKTAARTLTASIDDSTPGTPIPASFLGLSFEAKALPQIAHYGDEGNMVKLLRTLGPGVIRFGGVTVDTQVAWSPDGTSKPSWATTVITRADLAGVERLVREGGWGVLLDVNMAHYDPSAAADEVAAAQSTFGSELAGVEVGNEPDGYPLMHLRSDPYGWEDYRAQLDSYLNAIGRAFPLVGPGVSTPKRSAWIRGEAEEQRPVELSGHYYPLATCHGYLPVVDDLLRPGIRRAEKRVLGGLAAISNSTGLPLRVGETNNVACGGEAGVSNSFASALWALDYVTRAMSDGLAGINFHDIVGNCLGYGALCAPTEDDLAAGRLHAQPEWYALLLARQLLGDAPVRVKLPLTRANVTATAFRTAGGRLHVVLVDDEPPGSRPLVVKLKLGRGLAGGTLLRLTGPSPDATSGVRLGGVAVSSDGGFRPPHPTRLRARSGTLSVVLLPSSAALVSASPRRAGR